MPIYEIENKATNEKIAVKANNKSQALNFITAEAFNVEPMKPEAIVDYMEAGGGVQDATRSDAPAEQPAETADTAANTDVDHSAQGV